MAKSATNRLKWLNKAVFCSFLGEGTRRKKGRVLVGNRGEI